LPTCLPNIFRKDYFSGLGRHVSKRKKDLGNECEEEKIGGKIIFDP
jgi:hypothetical protein